MKLPGRTKSKITKNENGWPHLEITEAVLVRFNSVNNDSQYDSRALYKFVPNKSFGHFWEISTKSFIFLKDL